ncbi:hypothetical protein ACHAPA_011463 [Fusarium lateritium]
MPGQNQDDSTLAMSNVVPGDEDYETDSVYEEDDDTSEAEEQEGEAEHGQPSQSSKKRKAVAKVHNPRPSKRSGRPPGAAGKKKAEDAELLKSHRRAFNRFMPTLVEQRFSEIVGPTTPSYHAAWTRVDEHTIRHGDSEDNKALNLFRQESQDPKHQDLKMLFRFCCRAFLCDPYTLLSPTEGLGYMKATKRLDQSRVIWRKSFCEKLTRLVVHPLWNGEPDLFRLFLQYSTICRTDDRRKWKIDNLVPKGSLWGRLEAQLESWPAPYPFRVHALLEHVHRENYVSDVNFEVLLHLGDVIREKLKSKDQRRTDPKNLVDIQDGLFIRGVSIVDLEYVGEAIDTFTRHGFPFIPTVDASFKRYKELKNTSIDPPSKTQFYDWVERAWFQDRRRIEYAKGSNGRPEVTESRPVMLSLPRVSDPSSYEDMRE